MKNKISKGRILSPDKPDKNILALQDFLRNEVLFQDRAVKQLANYASIYNSPLRDKNEPIFSGIFLGPSGVGKTSMVKALAEYLMKSVVPEGISSKYKGKLFTPIECASYRSEHEYSKLIGAPPGYVGYDDPPKLAQESIDKPIMRLYEMEFAEKDPGAKKITDELANIRKQMLANRGNQLVYKSLYGQLISLQGRYDNLLYHFIGDRPIYSVILFDEIEKANSTLFNLMLNIIAEGEIHLGDGGETNFSNSFIIMTSNIGSRAIADHLARPEGKIPIGFAGPPPKVSEKEEEEEKKDPIYKIASDSLKEFFSAEFIGRIMENAIVFRPLDKDKIRAIVDLKINKLQGELKKVYPIDITIEEKVRAFISEESSDHPEYGARPVNDKIKKYLKTPLSKLINSGQIQKYDKIAVKMRRGKLIFIKEPDDFEKNLFKHFKDPI